MIYPVEDASCYYKQCPICQDLTQDLLFLSQITVHTGEQGGGVCPMQLFSEPRSFQLVVLTFRFLFYLWIWFTGERKERLSMEDCRLDF